jgi:hypothetical protein
MKHIKYRFVRYKNEFDNSFRFFQLSTRLAERNIAVALFADNYGYKMEVNQSREIF